MFLYLVRHGKTGKSWDPKLDMPLNSEGNDQSLKLALLLKDEKRLPILSSPLKRSKQSADPLSTFWNIPCEIDDRFGEIPFCNEDDIEPMDWLKSIMTKKWSQLPAHLNSWKANVGQAVCLIQEPSIIFTHYLTIAAIYSELMGVDMVDSFQSKNCQLVKLERFSEEWRFDNLG